MSTANPKRTLITDFFPAKKKDHLSKGDTSDSGSIGRQESTGDGAVNDNVQNEKENAHGQNNNEKVIEGSDTSGYERESSGKIGNGDAEDGKAPEDYTDFCAKHNFDKERWILTLSDEQRSLLSLEIETLHITWLVFLHGELTKPYFLKLKRFLHAQKGKTVFPPPRDIYSWSHYTPLPEVKCLVMGQDPYHNYLQAHGLAFSVVEPTKPPPSLVNIYKALKIDFPEFEIPDPKKLAKDGTPGGGNLTRWAKNGVLMLNACLTVEAHKANSHAKQGWETFTEQVIKAAILYHQKTGFVIMAWGSPAQKRVSAFAGLLKSNFFVVKSVHPSPLSAHRGFFEANVFRKCNDWLREQGKDPIDWGILSGNST